MVAFRMILVSGETSSCEYRVVVQNRKRIFGALFLTLVVAVPPNISAANLWVTLEQTGCSLIPQDTRGTKRVLEVLRV